MNTAFTLMTVAAASFAAVAFHEHRRAAAAEARAAGAQAGWMSDVKGLQGQIQRVADAASSIGFEMGAVCGARQTMISYKIDGRFCSDPLKLISAAALDADDLSKEESSHRVARLVIADVQRMANSGDSWVSNAWPASIEGTNR